MTNKDIFKAAWILSRNAVSVFGGTAKQYFSESLKTIYKQCKTPASKKTAMVISLRVNNKVITCTMSKGDNNKTATYTIFKNDLNYLEFCQMIPNRIFDAMPFFQYIATELNIPLKTLTNTKMVVTFLTKNQYSKYLRNSC